MRIGVIGTGLMGHGIGQACAQAGHEVRLFDVDLVQSGIATPKDIDNSFRLSSGIPFFLYGPLLATDLTVSKMTTLSVARYLHAETGHEKFRPGALLEEKVASGALGMPWGAGWYDWSAYDRDEVAARRDELLVRMLAYMRELGLVTEDPRRSLRTARARPTS